MANVLIDTEFHPNKNCCTIHIDKVLPDAGGWLSNKVPPDSVKPLFDALNQIEGVVTLRFGEKYQITITKGAVFSWDDITKKAIGILEEFYSV